MESSGTAPNAIRGCSINATITPIATARTQGEPRHAAVMAEVRRLDQAYNGGRPFPEVSAKGGELGRPMGE